MAHLVGEATIGQLGEAMLATPPCEPPEPFGIDSDDRLYYRCGTSLFRGSGESVSDDVTELVAVMADGRAVVQRSQGIAVLSSDGSTVATFDPATRYAGSMTLRPLAGSVNGDDAFVVYWRELPDSSTEIVVLRIDPSNEVLQVRRLQFDGLRGGDTLLAVSDGTVFIIRGDPDSTWDYLIRRFAPDGTESVVWRETGTTFDMDGPKQLLVGPLRP